MPVELVANCTFSFIIYDYLVDGEIICSYSFNLVCSLQCVSIQQTLIPTKK